MPGKIRWSRALLSLFFAVGLAPAFAQVRLNEVMANNASIPNSDFTITDWVELYNPDSQAADVGDMSLTDDSSVPRKWVFPPGSSVPANGYLVVILDSDRQPSTSAGASMNAGFSLSATGDAI